MTSSKSNLYIIYKSNGKKLFLATKTDVKIQKKNWNENLKRDIQQ